MKGRINSGLGQIVIDTDVIATYARSVAVECFGIIGMAGRTGEAFAYRQPEAWNQCQDHRRQ